MDKNLIEKFIAALAEFIKGFFGVQEKSLVEIPHIPKKGEKSSVVGILQSAINAYRGFSVLSVDNDFGPKTEREVQDIQKENRLTGTGVIGLKTLEILGLKLKEVPETEKKLLPWMTWARKYLGKTETDPEFSKMMVAKWPIVGLALDTIATSWAAWCGLFVAVAFSVNNMAHQKDGALARNWRKFGIEINYKVDGIPEGAVVKINNKGDCSSSSSNHVAFANGSCTATHLNKKGATIDLLGGNQNNRVKVSTYAVSKICYVGWPNDPKYPKPPKVTANKNCTSGADKNESTL